MFNRLAKRRRKEVEAGAYTARLAVSSYGERPPKLSKPPPPEQSNTFVPNPPFARWLANQAKNEDRKMFDDDRYEFVYI